MSNHIENVIVGTPQINPETIFAHNTGDWETNEKHKTLFTQERYLPKIMKEAGLVSSISEVKRNRPELCVKLQNEEFLKIKWGKKFLHILVGADDGKIL